MRATFDGVPYTGSLIKYGNPTHMLGILKAIREQIGKGPGDMVEVELWRDEGPRSIEVPAEFERAMKKADVASFFDGLSYTHRKEYVRWISDAKKEATRSARLEKAIEMLQKGVKSPDQQNL